MTNNMSRIKAAYLLLPSAATITNQMLRLILSECWHSAQTGMDGYFTWNLDSEKEKQIFSVVADICHVCVLGQTADVSMCTLPLKLLTPPTLSFNFLVIFFASSLLFLSVLVWNRKQVSCSEKTNCSSGSFNEFSLVLTSADSCGLVFISRWTSLASSSSRLCVCVNVFAVISLVSGSPCLSSVVMVVMMMAVCLLRSSLWEWWNRQDDL